MSRKTKLELTWIGKENRPRLEPRILLEEILLSYVSKKHSFKEDIFENNLIHGDNLLSLKALETKFSNKVKLAYIDPPYNTGEAFKHYNDGLEHSIWLSMMKDRVEIIHKLLSDDGSLWVSLDDHEVHYFKVMTDEIFGRENFIIEIIWIKRDGPPNDRAIGNVHEHILVYGKSRSIGSIKTIAEDRFNLMARTAKADSQYKVFDEPNGPDPRGPFRKIDTTANGKGGRHVVSLVFPILNPYTGIEVYPRKGTCWRHNREEMARLQNDNRLYWGVNGTANTPMRKLFSSEAKQGMTSPSVWSELALNQHASREMELLFGEKAAFETPKPEGLITRIVGIATNPGDLVLDSFAGSGTTGAVAHKMGRRWIMVELGEHCHTHIIPRMKKVIDGEDPGGITEAVGWKGGGGFRYYRLAPSLLEKDKWGHWVISKQYNAVMLAEAMCKHEGFTYAPSQEVYWQQGHSTERDFIYTTTHALNREQLLDLAAAVGPGRSLLICCKAFTGRVDDLENINVKKIPTAIAERCEFGKDDYSLQVANLPSAPPADDDDAPSPATAPAPKKSRRGAKGKEKAEGPGLFDDPPADPSGEAEGPGAPAGA